MGLLLARKKEMDETVESTAFPKGKKVPISLGQQRLWFLEQIDPGNSVWNVPMALRLRGELDNDILEKSLNEIVRRHETLRTTFLYENSEPWQFIRHSQQVVLKVEDLTKEPASAREALAWDLLTREANTSFDIEKGPLFRCRLFRLDTADHFLTLNMHHIVSDGWSMSICLQELGAIYSALKKGQPSPFEEIEFQYADFAEWQRSRLNDNEIQDQLSYWKEKLEKLPETLDIPCDGLRLNSDNEGGRELMTIPATLVQEIESFNRKAGVTLFMTVLSAFQILLHRLSGQKDIVVGSPFSGRDREETEKLIGFFMNTVVLRGDLGGNPTFRELLERSRQIVMEAYTNSGIPFEKLVNELCPVRGSSRPPFFQVFLNLLSYEEAAPPMEGLQVELHPLLEKLGAKFDMTLYLRKERGALKLLLSYRSSLFSSERMREFLAQFQQILSTAVQSPDKKIDDFSLVTTKARSVLPDPRKPLVAEKNQWIDQSFSAWASRKPDWVAIEEPLCRSTYGELESESNHIANTLLRAGVLPGEVIVIYGTRQASLVKAILGVLKAGAAFVILDPSYPVERLIQCFSLAVPAGWIYLPGSGAVPPRLLEILQRMTLKVTMELSSAADSNSPKANRSSDSLAYILFTSGSTGRPKGIEGTHAPVAHFLDWHIRQFQLNEKDRFSFLAGLSHDPLFRDIFTPLSLGATLCIPDSETLKEPEKLVSWIRRKEITVMHLTPGMGELIISGAQEPLTSLKHLFFGGDVLTARHVEEIQRVAPDAEIVNFYGATETPQAMGWHRVETQDRRFFRVPLGRGIDDAQLLVLSSGNGLAGVGELGEIAVRTPYLSLGYRGDPALTAEKFVANPFRCEANDRLYRTGDRGRYLPDGSVQFEGRMDRQIKIRGHRIEPEEIQAALNCHPLISESLVLARESGDGEKRLVAYLIHRPGFIPDIQEVRDFLAPVLPEVMIPQSFVFLVRFPLTVNGKIDQSRLPNPESVGVDAERHVEPRNPLELQLVETWEELLQVRPIGIRDNFFALGGHSLLAVRLMDRIHRVLGRKLPLSLLFSGATIERLAGALIQEKTQSHSPFVEIQRGSGIPFVFLHGDYEGGGFYSRRLAEFLGTDVPFYIIEPHGLDGRPIPDSIEKMAEENVALLKKHLPEGPYYLGGHCNGGLVAFEMARQLEASGVEIKKLILIDVPETNFKALYYAISFLGGLLRCDAEKSLDWYVDVRTRLIRFKRWNLQSFAQKKAWVRKNIGKLNFIVPRDPLSVEEGRNEWEKERLRTINLYARLIGRYFPRPYHGRIHLILNRSTRKIWPGGWDQVSRGVEVMEVEGDHLTMLTKTVHCLADAVHRSLFGINRGSSTVSPAKDVSSISSVLSFKQDSPRRERNGLVKGVTQ